MYLAPIADKDGKSLEAGSLYRIRIPKDTPAKQFWSITVYDNANWGFIENPLDRSGLGTFDKDKMKVNDDGSVDIYVGPKAPEGWNPTGFRRWTRSRTFGCGCTVPTSHSGRRPSRCPTSNW